MDILKAVNNVNSAVWVSQLSTSVKQEVVQSLEFLKENALKAVSDQPAQTAIQIDERHNQAEKIAHGDDLDMLTAIMPFF